MNLTVNDLIANNTTCDLLNLYEEFSRYPVIYLITVYHIYPIVALGRAVHLLWYVIGVTGNMISLKVWMKPRVRKVSQAAPYLISITFCDLLYQCMHVFSYLKYFWGLSSLGASGLCQIWNILYLLPQYASQLLVFGFTAERLIAVYQPFKSERFSRNQRARVIVTVILTFAVMISLPQSLFWRLNSAGFCEIQPDVVSVFMYRYWTLITEVIIFLVFPIMTLICNIFVLRYVRQSLKTVYQGSMELKSSFRFIRIHKSSHSYKPATRTLMIISLFRMLSQLPVSIAYSLQNFKYFNFGSLMSLAQMRQDVQWQRFLTYWSIRMLVDTFGASHHALGVFIYYSSSKQFQMELQKMFRCSKEKKCVRQKVRYHSTTQNGLLVTPRTHKTHSLSM